MRGKPIKLSPKKNGAGYITSYSINLGCAEVRDCSFLDKDGQIRELEKLIDSENNQIIIRIKKEAED